MSRYLAEQLLESILVRSSPRRYYPISQAQRINSPAMKPVDAFKRASVAQLGQANGLCLTHFAGICVVSCGSPYRRDASVEWDAPLAP